MFVNDGEMLVNDGDMSIWSCTHFAIIDWHFTIINEHFTIISLKKAIICSFDHHGEAAPTVMEKGKIFDILCPPINYKNDLSL